MTLVLQLNLLNDTFKITATLACKIMTVKTIRSRKQYFFSPLKVSKSYTVKGSWTNQESSSIGGCLRFTRREVAVTKIPIPLHHLVH